MSTIVNINGSDRPRDSRSVINQNFTNLNNDKVETLTDLGVTQTAANINANLPSATEKAAFAGGGALGTPSGTNKFLTEAYFTASPPQVIAFTASGTWTKDPGLKYITVKVQAAGGRGTNDGPGGGAGGYSEKLISAASLGATETVTVGAANAGTGNTSFGTHVVCGNGSNSGAGGTATGGDINIPGQAGGAFSGYTTGYGGSGASSLMGVGGSVTINFSATNIRNGQPASGYGAGGAGGAPATDNSPSNGIGGDGTPGIVIVTEYY